MYKKRVRMTVEMYDSFRKIIQLQTGKIRRAKKEYINTPNHPNHN